MTLSLFVGATRSGKSALAERRALAHPGPVHYLATAALDPADTDFAGRVAAHRRRRGDRFVTVETGIALPAALRAEPDGTALVDALGSWVAAHPDLDPDIDALRDALAARSGPTVVVAEAVGWHVHAEHPSGRRFVDVLGRVTAAVAEDADEAWLVVAGRLLPLEPVGDRW